MRPLPCPDRSRMLKKAADFAGLPRAHMMCALHTYFRNGELQSLLIPDFYRELVREGTSAERWADMGPAGVNDPAEQLMSAEIASLLHADYLRKVDVASSAHGLEVRTPYLDTEVFRFSAELETGLKVRRNSSKHVLRLLARRLLPAGVIDRPKQGFGVPLDRWAGGRMRQFFRDLLMGDSARGSRV